MYYQQGDILVCKIERLPKGSKAIKTKDIEKSTTTGNSHSLQGGVCQIKTEGNKKYLSVKKQTTLTHQEHKPIKIPKGEYEIRKVLEYDHMEEESREVKD
jgi:hypothetical protein